MSYVAMESGQHLIRNGFVFWKQLATARIKPKLSIFRHRICITMKKMQKPMDWKYRLQNNNHFIEVPMC